MKITELAKTEINNILSQEKGKLIRIFMAGFGWGGPNLGMTLDELQKDDTKLNIDGIDFLVNKKDESYISNFTVDYIDDYRGKGLTINSNVSC